MPDFFFLQLCPEDKVHLFLKLSFIEPFLLLKTLC